MPPIPGRDGKCRITCKVFNLKGDGSWGEETDNSHPEPDRICSHSICPQVNHLEFRCSWKKIIFAYWCLRSENTVLLITKIAVSALGQKEQYTIKEKQMLINKLLSKTMSPDLWQFKLQDKPFPRRSHLSPSHSQPHSS